MNTLAIAFFFGGACLMVVSVGFLLILGHNNTDIIEISKEIRLFVICIAFMTSGIGIKVLFT